MRKSAWLLVILCAVCTCAPQLTSAIAANNPADRVTAGVHVIFDLSAPERGPFPSDWFTVADPEQLTGRRVNMPLPDCGAGPSDCVELGIINQLDGFSLQPRLSIPFTGAIDVATVSSTTVFLVSLGDVLTGAGAGDMVGINQIIWDPLNGNNALHAESDQLLNQHTRYALIVTNGVHDSAGNPVQAGDFGRFRHDLNFGQERDPILKEYRKALIDALDAWGGDASLVVAASVFTTQSPTAMMEKIRDQLKAATPQPAVFNLATKIAADGTVQSGLPAVFNMADIPATSACNPSNPDAVNNTGLCLYNHTNPKSAALSNTVTPFDYGRTLAEGPEGQEQLGVIAFGKYLSPDYETADKYIPQVPTRTGIPEVQRQNEIYFNLFLPAGPKPAGGWPAIFGHGIGESKQNSLFVPAARIASHGIATIAINAVGHGLGAAGVLTVKTTNGVPFKIPAGGRGVDLDGNGTIDTTDGLFAAGPFQLILNERDGLRQTIADTMQLVRVIQVGMDVDGDGTPDLDASHIYYFGQSMGGINGALFMALEPDVHTGAMNAAGGPILDAARLNVGGLRSVLTGFMTPRRSTLPHTDQRCKWSDGAAGLVRPYCLGRRVWRSGRVCSAYSQAAA